MKESLRLAASLDEERRKILEHPLYPVLNGEARLRRFLEAHCFAVWDFMSLLKFLQRRFTSVDLPWRPVGDPESRRLLNEIVLAEESDEDGRGGYASHFELYRRAMQECGADLAPLDRFLARLEAGADLESALRVEGLPEEAAEFVLATFEILRTESLPGIAAALAYGREELVPKMFHRLVTELSRSAPSRWTSLRFYLERHVQLDGELHGPMAGRLLERLCGDDPRAWRSAEQAAKQSLRARRIFWDRLHRRLLEI